MLFAMVENFAMMLRNAGGDGGVPRPEDLPFDSTLLKSGSEQLIHALTISRCRPRVETAAGLHPDRGGAAWTKSHAILHSDFF